MIIRAEQMAALQKYRADVLLVRVSNELREKYPDRLPVEDSELRALCAAWIDDAFRWGFKTDSDIVRYASSCAENQGRVEPLEVRLATYLKLYRQPLLEGVELPSFVLLVLQLAANQDIREEEGIAWLSVILLSGKRHGADSGEDTRWITESLSRARGSEEARLHQVHEEAAALGWLIPRQVRRE